MLSWMIITYFICLGLGWGLLLLDYIIIRMERRSMSEPWANDVVVIGGASAVLSPIINWGEIILNSNPAGEVQAKRLQFYKAMWLIYVAIVGLSTLVAIVRFAAEDDGTLHHFITTTSNHLVLARISASLLTWGAGKLCIRWYQDRLAAGPLF